MLVRTVECLEGRVEIELVCEPVFDYGRDAGRVDAGRRTTATRRRDRRRRRRSACAPTSRSGSRATASAAATSCSAGERAFCALSWAEGLRGAARASTRPRSGSTRPTRFWRAWLGRARHPRPPLARPDPALGAGDQGPDLHADRRDRGGAHDLAAGDAGRRAQLGLPLHLDARRDVHAAGAALAQPRLGGRRVHAVRRRPRAERGRLAADHVRHRRPARPDGVDARRTSRATRAHGPCGSATAPSTSARTTCTAPCSTRSCSTRARSDRLPQRLWPIVETQAECATQVWREPDQGIWEARGEPQHYVSSKLMCWVALDRGARLAAIRGDERARRAPGGRRPTRSTRTSSSTASRDRGVLRQHYETDALDASTLLAAIFGFLPGRRRAPARHRAGDRRRADRERLRPALPHRRDRRRPVGQGGHVPDLLVLARLGARDRRRARSAARDLMERLLRDRLAARPLRRGVRRRHRPAPRQLPAGVLPPGADRGRGADHRRRAAGAARDAADGRRGRKTTQEGEIR